jgi:acyl-CoA dehydrogenase
MPSLIDFARRKNLLPRMSETERQALEAGTVWVEASLFSGRPDFRRILSEPYPELTERERTFLDGPVEEVCRRVDPWEYSRRRELPLDVWAFLKRERFFGLTIPPEFGGHGFSAIACSTIFAKLASRSLPLSAVVLIPNSVGPGELLLEYGTPEQRAHYLPRLARGEEIPCFALTEPEAGSDAASITSRGVVFRGRDGQPKIRLDWEKRYITLAPVATLIGLAVRLFDPENLLGKGKDVGITCVLVPTSLPGVEVGRRHDPMGIPFPNGPTTGRDVVVGLDAIPGGAEGAGRGWRMLMEALSAGRSISLPAQSVGGAKLTARAVGAYAAVRRQFGLPIGRFEGIEEPLARIAGLTYLMEAARVYTCGAVDSGHRPAVVSAIVKVQQTELARQLVMDGMDVLGGAGISRGPRNVLADGYAGSAIGITVEGANILTRTLIVFGQGAIRCHPYTLAEMRALEAGDEKALRRALLGHAGHVLRNLGRLARLTLSRGRLMRSPGRDQIAGPLARDARRLAWASARFAVRADLALFALGGRLKLKEKLSGRFADALSWMFLAAATIRRFEAEGRRAEDLPLARWALEWSFARIQEALEGIDRNLEGPLGALLRGPFLFFSRLSPLGAGPSDRLGSEAAAAILTPGERRDRLTADLFLPEDADSGLGRLERALLLAAESRPALEAVREASRDHRLPKGDPEALLDQAVAAGVIDSAAAGLVREAAEARRKAIEVDSFELEEYLGMEGTGNRAQAAPFVA